MRYATLVTGLALPLERLTADRAHEKLDQVRSLQSREVYNYERYHTFASDQGHITSVVSGASRVGVGKGGGFTQLCNA